MIRIARAPKLAVTALALVAACSSDPAPAPSSAGAAASIFVVPPSLDALDQGTFFDQPFPSDLRREADGTVRFVGLPNPANVPILGEFVQLSKGMLDGFSPAGAIYLRFTAPLDPASLPADPPSTLSPQASVQIIDVDPASPEHGKRHLAQLFFQADEGVYWASNTLAVLPMLGRPLRPKTRYAVVVTRGVRAASGGEVAPSDQLEEVLGVHPATDATRAAHDRFAPVVAELEAAGVHAADVVHFTSFTTNDPTAETFAIADDVRANVPAPKASGWAAKDQAKTYDVYEGSYGPSPNYQAGTPPYAKPADGGGFVFQGGKPVLQDTFDLRFALAVPKAAACPPPAVGYPVVLYAHGTGGDYRSFIDDGTADALATQCLASMGIDQIFHGTRPGAPPADDPQRESDIELLFFNFNNPVSARTSNRQAAIDVVQQARLFTDAHATVPAAVSRTQADIAFDPTRVMFFGHSQGGLNGPLYLAADPSARGGVLSGAGSVLGLALLEKTKPVDVGAALKFLLGLTDPERAKELSVYHPVITFLQSVVDAADPLNYASAITTAPRAGFASKSVFQTEGVAPDGTGDSYAPPHVIEALSVAIGLPRAAPGVRAIQEATWAGLADVTIPASGLSGNLAAGKATGVLAQFVPKAGHDGHFVVFDDPRARTQAAVFLKNLASDPIGRVPAE